MKSLKVVCLLFSILCITSCAGVNNLSNESNEKYNVTFLDSFGFAQLEGGGEYSSGDSVTIKATLNKGYEFKSWVINENSNITSNPYTFIINSNTDVNLNFDYTTYNVYLDSNGGIVPGNKSKIPFTIISETFTLPTPTKEGFSFIGWKEVNASNFIFKINKGTTEDISVVAQWKKIEQQDIIVTLVCDKIMGNVDGAGKYTAGKYFSVNAYPNKGYEFDGWYLNDSLLSTEEVSYFKFDNNVTLEARFKAIFYSITYNLNKGILPIGSLEKYTIETPTFSLPIPTRESDENYDYEFVNWKDSKGNVITKVEKGTTGDLSFTAYWKENKKQTKYKMVTSATSYDYSKGILFEETLEPTILRLIINVKCGDKVAFTDGSNYINNFNKTGMFNAFQNDYCYNSSYFVTFTQSGEYNVELNIYSTPIIDIIS